MVRGENIFMSINPGRATGRYLKMDSGAARANPIDLQLVVECHITSRLKNLLSQSPYRIGSGNRFNASTVNADQLAIAGFGIDQVKIARFPANPETPHDLFRNEPLEDPKDGRSVALARQIFGLAKFGQRHRPIAIKKTMQKIRCRAGAPEARGPASFDQDLELRLAGLGFAPVCL